MSILKTVVKMDHSHLSIWMSFRELYVCQNCSFCSTAGSWNVVCRIVQFVAFKMRKCQLRRWWNMSSWINAFYFLSIYLYGRFSNCINFFLVNKDFLVCCWSDSKKIKQVNSNINIKFPSSCCFVYPWFLET